MKKTAGTTHLCVLARVLLAGIVLVLTLALPSRAFQPPQRAALPDLDQRRIAPPAARGSAEQTQAAANLAARVAGVKVEFDPVISSPKFISAADGFLSGPDGEGRAVAKAAVAGLARNDPHRATKAFLTDHRALFGHGPEALAAARIKRDFTATHNGMKTVVWEQHVNGVPVFEAVLISHTTAKGELVNLSSQFVPAPDAAANRGVPARAAVLAAPAISAAQAVKLAAVNLGEPVQNELATAADAAEVAPEKKQKFRAAFLRGEGEAKLVWLPMDKDTLRLCWDVILTGRQRSEMYRVLVDAESGVVHIRRSLTAYISDASYRVFTSDSPSPFSPGHPTPLTTQPPLVARTLVTLPALDTNASPAGWINDGGNETLGNNVDAHTDLDNNNAPDLPRPQGSPFRVFDFPLDLTSQAPSAYRSAAVVQLFYVCNWMHDKLYALGFTEAAGNFQSNNFGRGGLGNDAVQADAQDGGGTDNANFSTPPDGSPGRMQMYVFSGPSPDRDGDFDAEIVLHEYTHGLSNRRVGGGVGISALQSAGLGEGWSDWYGLTLLSESGDDVNANYAAGGYATLQFGATNFLQNYYYGIRRYPYSTDLTKNPLTFKDIDPAQASSHPGVPISPVIGGGGASEVHNQGEVWCVTLWEARANLVNKYGFEVGNQLILQLVTDGMNLSPANPNFLQARDAILQADLVLTGGANRNELWAAFAKRGMGATATSPLSATTSGVHEAFDVPDDLSIVPASGFTAHGPVGGPFIPSLTTFTITNTGTAPLNWTMINTTAWLNVSPSGGTLTAGGPAATITASLNTSASSLPMGIYSDSVRFTNLTSGVGQGRQFVLRAGQPDYFTEDFTSRPFDLSYRTLTFTPDSSGSFYRACQGSAAAFPTDPSAGISIALADDGYRQVMLTNGRQVSIYGISSNAIYIGANGNVTFDPGPNTNAFFNNLGLNEFFARTRVAPFYTDLNPAAGGTVSYRQLGDRFVVTWQEVPEYGMTNLNSLQVELFFDGPIRMTWLRAQFTSTLNPVRYAGLSRGTGVPVNFLGSDLSAYAPCLPPLMMTAISGLTEGAGLVAGAGHVSLPAPLTTNLTVSLASSDTSEVTVPASVIIPAGQTNQSFDVTIVDDAELDGTQTAVITATVPGFLSGSAMIAVHDNETATLQVVFPATVSEGGGTAPGIVQVSAAPATSVTVSLTSSDVSVIQVPASVVIPAGQTSVVFTAMIVDDALIDGAQTATITAHVQNWTDGTATVTVLDNESTNLVVTLAASALENAGPLLNAGTVRLSGALPTNLVVSLNSSDPATVTVPLAVTIPASQTIGYFNVTVVDDFLVDGPQTATVTASAPGFADGAASMTVLDDETPLAPSNPFPPDLASNVPANTALSWSNGRPGVTNDLSFGTNSTPGIGEFFGSTTSGNWALPLLAPNTTYYWQIVARKIGATTGPVWSFTTRGLHHFDLSAVASPQFIDQPFNVTITARDELNRAVTNFAGPVALSASLPALLAPTTTGAFTDGVWSGTVSVSGPATNLTVQALAASGHFGTSNPFHVVASNQPPIILTPPVSRVVPTGATVNLSVSAYGVPPFSYQWRFNGGDLPGETNATLTLINVITNQSGNYSVAVTNLSGVVISENAVLIVAAGVEVLHVSNIGNNTIRTFDFTGRDLGIFASTLSGAFALASDRSGNLYAAEVNNNVVQKFDAIGVSSVFATTGLNGPDGVVVDRSGNLYVANYFTSKIFKYDANGAPSVFATTGLAGPARLALDTNDNLYVANYDNSSIVEFDVNGTSSVFATTGLSAPTCLAFDGGGRLYAANYGNNTIVSFDAAGTPSIFANSGLSAPTSMAFDRSGNLYVANSGNHTVAKFDTNGVPSTFANTGLSTPYGLAVALVVPTAPAILTQPASQTVNEWQSASFAVVTTGFPSPYYQWRKDGVDLAGATSATYSLKFVRTNQAGNYTVVASNSAGSVTSAPAVLTVNPRPLFFTNFGAIQIQDDAPASPYPSTITVSGVTNLIANINVTLYGMSHSFAADISVLLVGPNGQTVVLMSEAGGGSNLDDTTLVFDDGATNSLPLASRIFSGTYKPTDYFTNLVFYPPAPIRPYGPALSGFNGTDPNGVWKLFVIDTEGGDIGIIAGGWAISLTGDDTPPALRFAWSAIPSPQFTNAPITVTIQARDSSNQIVTNFAGPVFLRDASTGGLVSNSILPSPNHTVITALNPYTLGYSFTPGTNLTVRAVRHYFGTKVSIWTDAGLVLVAQPVTSVPGTWVETPLATPLSLTAGTRYRVASYIAGGNSYYANGLSTNFPNGTINQTYSSPGDGFPTVSNAAPWLVDLRYTAPSAPVPIMPAITGDFTNGTWSGVVRSISPATNLVLLADDGAGHYGSSNPFHVVRSNQPPVIIAPPPNQTVNAGRNASFSLNAYGTPNLTYQWRRNGTNITNGGRVSGTTNSVLTISNVIASDAALYSVTVGNTFGSALSSSAMLTINPVDHFSWSFIPSPVSTLAPLAVTVQARDFLNNVATSFTGTVAVSASLAGTATPVPVSPAISGAFVAGVWNGNLSLPQVATNAVLRAIDGLGDFGLSAPFDVAQVAAFTLQPTNQNVLPGTNVTLAAFAVGTGPVRYQWRFEGTNILDATNASHSFTGANLANHHGSFSVVARDDLGTVFSSNAFIYVLVKPGIVQHIVSQSVLQGRSLTFTLVATGAPPLWYRWLKGGGGYATTSVPVLVITNIQASAILRVAVTNRASPPGTYSPGPNSFQNVNITMIPDADGDGLPDAWELAYFGNPTNATATADSDGDGVSNRDEYLAGTNPTNQLSYLKIDSVVTVGSGHDLLLLEFSAVSNKTYTLQSRDEIATAGWSNLLHFESAPTNRMVALTNAMPPAIPTRYYRLITPRQNGE